MQVIPVFPPPEGPALHVELIIEIIQRYTGRLMRLLVVSKWMGRLALNYLVGDVNDPHGELVDRSVLGTICNVRTFTMHHWYYADVIDRMNPVSLCVEETAISKYRTLYTGLSLTRLTKLVLNGDILTNECLARLTTLTSLDIICAPAITSVVTLVHLRELSIGNDVDYSGCMLTMLHIDSHVVDIVACMSLHTLHLHGVAMPPIIASGIMLTAGIFHYTDVPASYIACTRSLTRLDALESQLPEHFMNDLDLRVLSMRGDHGDTVSLHALTNLQSLTIEHEILGPLGLSAHLTHLCCYNANWLDNNIEMLPGLLSLQLFDEDAYDDSLRGFTTLTALHMSCEAISDIQTLTRLQSLTIEGSTSITAKDLSHLDALTWFSGERNEIAMGELRRLFDRRRSLYGVTAVNPALRLMI